MANPNPYNQRGPDGKLVAKSSDSPSSPSGDPDDGAQAPVAGAAMLAEPPETAEEREMQRARSRGVPEAEIARWRANVFWGLSGRADDRVVLFERDPRHPGGEAFIGGSQPDLVYRTPQVQQLVMQGLIIETPEPRRTVRVRTADGQDIEVPNRRYPVSTFVEAGLIYAAPPGRPIPLGRKLDPELYEPEDIAAVERRLSGRPDHLAPNGAYVPTQAEVDRPA